MTGSKPHDHQHHGSAKWTISMGSSDTPRPSRTEASSGRRLSLFTFRGIGEGAPTCSTTLMNRESAPSRGFEVEGEGHRRWDHHSRRSDRHRPRPLPRDYFGLL